MKVLIVAATKFEIESVLRSKINADFLVTGVGIPATIFHLNKKLMSSQYDLVINAGIAGCFSRKFNLGDVLLVEEDTFGDLGISHNNEFKTLFDAGFSAPDEFPFSGGWLKNKNAKSFNLSPPLVKAVTVNKITDDKIQVQKLKEKFAADIESMEGAAFHYVCIHQQIQFLQIRSISNHVGECDKSNWEIKKAIVNLNEELFKILEKEKS
ncbi:MAG: futalosine hydrolase [Ginsengibacter sp.]